MLVSSHLSTLAPQPWRPEAESAPQKKSSETTVTYRLVDGPVGRLGLAEAAVGGVGGEGGGEGGVLAGAGEEEQGAVDDDGVPAPVLTARPAAALHLHTHPEHTITAGAA